MKYYINMGKPTYEEYLEKNTKNFVGSGKNGKCYKTDDNELLKVFYKNASEKKLMKFSDVENDSIMFPENVIAVDGRIKAVTRKYVNGKTLREDIILGTQIEIDKLALALKKLTEDLKKLSNDSVMVKDIVWSNVIWDGSNFKLIDSYYYKRSKASKDYITFCNLRDTLDPILNWIIDKDMYNFFMNSDVSQLFINAEYLKNPENILLQLKKYLEYYLDDKVNSFADAEKKLILSKH